MTKLECKTCRKILPLSSFWKNKDAGKRAFHWYCKECVKARLRRVGYWKKMYERNKHNPSYVLRRRARQAARNARKRGLLAPTKCVVCQSTKNLELHHYKGYAKKNWLLVKTYCTIHHKEIHGVLTTIDKTDSLSKEK